MQLVETEELKRKKQEKAQKIAKQFATAPQHSVVFLGASHTEDLPVSGFCNHEYVNAGVGGNTILDVIKRVEPVIVNQPSKLFLMIGTNDILFHGDDPIHETGIFLDLLVYRLTTESVHSDIVIQTIPPVTLKYAGLNSKIIQYNDMVKRIAAIYKHELIDLYSSVVDHRGNLRLDLTTDGIHLNDTGYGIWADLLKKHL